MKTPQIPAISGMTPLGLMERTVTRKMVRSIIKAAFPAWKGRKLRLESAERCPKEIRSFWDEGSRDYFAFVRLHDMSTLQAGSNHPAFEPNRPSGLPFLPEGFALVRHSIFCGKEAGMTVWIAGHRIDTASLVLLDE